MTDTEKRAAAKQFAADWQGRGDEKQETARFWTALLQKVFDVAEPDKYIDFEVPVKLGHVNYIDGFIPSTRVRSIDKGLNKITRHISDFFLTIGVFHSEKMCYNILTLDRKIHTCGEWMIWMI